MSEPVGTYEEEKRSLIRIVKSVIINHKPFHRWLEKHSIYIQMDDIDRVCSILLKTLKGFKESGENLIYPAYKIEYRDFFITLLRKTVIHSAWIEELLKAKSENWDIERFAALDILLLKMAVTEGLEFPSIPAKVTMNEYIEFAKNYSTDKSSSFVNGLLEKVLQELELQGKIKKMPLKEIQVQEKTLKVEPLIEEKPKRKRRISLKKADK
jgi:N utilization substance protein B